MTFVNNPASATPFDNSSNGFAASNMQAAIEEAKSSSVYYSVTGTSTLTTTSATFSVVSGMTMTPVAGTYLVMFSTDIEAGTVNGRGEVQIFNGGSAVTGTNRQIELEVALLLGLIGTSRMNIGAGCLFGVVTANGTNTIDIRYRSIDGQTITITSRAMFAFRIGA